MTPIFWLGVAALVVIFYLGSILIGELKAIRAVLAQMLGSLAEASWRTRDELAAINKRKENGATLIPPQK